MQNPVSEAAEQRAGQAEEPELLHGVSVWTELGSEPEGAPPSGQPVFLPPSLLPFYDLKFAFSLNLFTKLDTLGSGQRGPEAAPWHAAALGLVSGERWRRKISSCFF